MVQLQNDAINDGYCGTLPASAIGVMVRGQIAPDIWMASVVQDASKDVEVLIAANGHLRKDAGVYQWLTPEQQSHAQVHG